MLDARGDHGRLDRLEPRRGEQLGQVTLARPREIGLVLRVGVDRVHGLPEHAERTLPAGVVPHAGRDGAAGPRHARHLPQSGDRIPHEVDDELRERGVERSVLEGQLFGGIEAHVDTRVALPCRGHERG
jgi:hypothetical protein